MRGNGRPKGGWLPSFTGQMPMAKGAHTASSQQLRAILGLHVAKQRETDMPTSIRLSPDTEHRLASIVEKTGRTKSFYIREMIERSIDDVEDYYLAAEVLKRVRNGEEDIFTEDEVRRELGLEG